MIDGLMDKIKNSSTYKDILEVFSDAELIDIKNMISILNDKYDQLHLEYKSTFQKL